MSRTGPWSAGDGEPGSSRGDRRSLTRQSVQDDGQRQLHPLLVHGAGGVQPVGRQTALERLSVQTSVDNLMTYPFVSSLVEAGSLSVHGAWFNIAAGELWWLDPDDGKFRAVTDDESG